MSYYDFYTIYKSTCQFHQQFEAALYMKMFFEALMGRFHQHFM
jgi:hypothetical protein